MEQDAIRIHFTSQIGMETRLPDRFLWKECPLTSTSYKRIHNKTWWHFYPLLLLSIIAYPIAQIATLALLFFIVGLLENIGLMSPILAIGFGVIGGLACIAVHYIVVDATFMNLPDRSRYIHDYSYKINK